jgi:hypothetical protein
VKEVVIMRCHFFDSRCILQHGVRIENTISVTYNIIKLIFTVFLGNEILAPALENIQEWRLIPSADGMVIPACKNSVGAMYEITFHKKISMSLFQRRQRGRR